MPPIFAQIDVEGVDAGRFLQAQLACQVSDLEPGRWRYGCCCLSDGRVLALFLLGCRDTNCYQLLLPLDLTDTLCQHLLRFRLRSKISITHHPVSVLGDSRRAKESSHGGECHRDARGTAWLGVGFGWLLSADPQAAAPLDAADWGLQLDLHVPWLCAATSARFLPQMLGLDRLAAFSLRKGCYPGQEVIARAHFRGAVKRRLAGLAVPADATMAAGSPLSRADGGEAGHLLYLGAGDEIQALAVVHAGVQPGSDVIGKPESTHARVVWVESLPADLQPR